MRTNKKTSNHGHCSLHVVTQQCGRNTQNY